MAKVKELKVKDEYPEAVEDVQLPELPQWTHVAGRPKTLKELDSSTGNLAYLNQITETEITDNSISTPKLQAGAVEASKISVGNLSAINADLGSITSGTITGALIRTSSAGTRVELDQTSNDLKIYDSGTLRARGYDQGWSFYNPSGSSVADIYADTTALGTRSLLLTASASSTGAIYLNAGSSGKVGLYAGGTPYLTVDGNAGYTAVHEDLVPTNTLSLDLGRLGAEFARLWVTEIILDGVPRTSWPSSGTTTLSGLSIDTSKNWNGYDISNVDTFSCDEISLDGVGSYVDFNGGYVDDVRAIYMETGRTTNPSLDGEIRYYDGGSEGLRIEVANTTFQFDLTVA